MTQGINAAASGMINVVTYNDIIANNMANINTPGFKQSIVSFKNLHDKMISQINPDIKSNNTEPVGKLSSGIALNSVSFDFKQGGIKVTGNPLDIAINGNGFFMVETPDGPAYTRNGTFIRRDDGFISTTDGHVLVAESGPLSIDLTNAQVKEIQVDTEGNITLKGEKIDKLKIVDFEDRSQLEALGNSLFKPKNDSESPVEATKFEISQGSLETSNANIVECMVKSITGVRTYEALQKVVEAGNKTLSKAVTEVGKTKM